MRRPRPAWRLHSGAGARSGSPRHHGQRRGTGFIATDMTESLPEAQQEALLGQIPLSRLGRPEEIAAAVGFLTGETASYITGETLHVNGGMSMR